LAGELSDDYWTRSAATAAVPPDPLNLVQSLGGQVAFTAIRATGDGNILDHQQVPTIAIAPGHAMGSSSLSAADITDA
jgi:hypothetical protein